MIIHSQHRSLALAIKHLSQLKRQYWSAELLSRRDAKGRISERGRQFYFEVRKKPRGKVEYVVHFDYGTVARKNLIRFQVHVIGPPTRNDAKVISAIKEIERSNTPKGWRWKAIFWGRPEDKEIARTDGMDLVPKRAAILGGAAKVAHRSKSTVSSNRRSRKRRKGKAR